MTQAVLPLVSKETTSWMRSLVSSRLCVAEHELTDWSDFYFDMGADELDVIELVMAIEREFAIRVPDAAIPQLRTMGAFTLYVAGRLLSRADEISCDARKGASTREGAPLD